jgi:hypothetical protein
MLSLNLNEGRYQAKEDEVSHTNTKIVNKIKGSLIEELLLRSDSDFI